MLTFINGNVPIINICIKNVIQTGFYVLSHCHLTEEIQNVGETPFYLAPRQAGTRYRQQTTRGKHNTFVKFKRGSNDRILINTRNSGRYVTQISSSCRGLVVFSHWLVAFSHWLVAFSHQLVAFGHLSGALFQVFGGWVFFQVFFLFFVGWGYFFR